MKNEELKIFGKLTDKQGRCVHYNSVLDVIANKCGKCQKFYACFNCHDEAENHKFAPLPHDEKATVMCGVCKRLFSYDEYSSACECPSCKSQFNPRCSLHKKIYVC